jgi:hypothetical protein
LDFEARGGADKSVKEAVSQLVEGVISNRLALDVCVLAYASALEVPAKLTSQKPLKLSGWIH